jgi:hypothetical protein
MQELLAPEQITFCGKTWICLETQGPFISTIALASGIEEKVLFRPNLTLYELLAKRMAWASNRETTRVEDRAYYLLGIFNVNMPILYGEGKRAFIRLQEEIIKVSIGETLFGWYQELIEFRHGFTGALAPSPKAFTKSTNLTREIEFEEDSAPYFSTKGGLKMELPLVLYKMPLEIEVKVRNGHFPSWVDRFVGMLQCILKDNEGHYVVILLKRVRVSDSAFRGHNREL